MVASALLSLALFAASSFVPVVRAGPIPIRAELHPFLPIEPVKYSTYNAGSNCHIEWKGDETSHTKWKGMTINLMTGPNLNMVQLKTVATDQDGTVDGKFDYTCPEVTINAAVYFYQFSSAGSAGNPTWTTRFTIASSSGQNVTEPSPTQPAPGSEPTPWGTGELVTSPSLSRRGSPYPTEPVQGKVYNAGSTCHIAWQGDKTSTTMWKEMSIQLMTGANLNVVQLMTVATNQDGTVDGTFDFKCPEVTINAPIYFYRFTSAGSAGNPNFSTRFTIASSTGKVEPAPYQTQPAGEPVPWGTGQIATGKSSSSGSSSSSTSVTSSKTGSTSATSSKKSASTTWTGTSKGVTPTPTTTPTTTPTSATNSNSRHDGTRGGTQITTTTATVTTTVATQTKTVTVWPATITTQTATVWPSSIATVTVWPSSITTVTVRPSQTQTVTVWPSSVQTVTAVSTQIVDKPITVTVVEDHVTTVVTTTTSAELRMTTVTTSSSPSDTDTGDDEVAKAVASTKPKNAAMAGLVFDLRLAVVAVFAGTVTLML